MGSPIESTEVYNFFRLECSSFQKAILTNISGKPIHSCQMSVIEGEDIFSSESIDNFNKDMKRRPLDPFESYEFKLDIFDNCSDIICLKINWQSNNEAFSGKVYSQVK